MTDQDMVVLSGLAGEVWRLGTEGELSMESLLRVDAGPEWGRLVTDLAVAGERRGNCAATLAGDVELMKRRHYRRKLDQLRHNGLYHDDRRARELIRLDFIAPQSRGLFLVVHRGHKAESSQADHRHDDQHKDQRHPPARTPTRLPAEQAMVGSRRRHASTLLLFLLLILLLLLLSLSPLFLSHPTARSGSVSHVVSLKHRWSEGHGER